MKQFAVFFCMTSFGLLSCQASPTPVSRPEPLLAKAQPAAQASSQAKPEIKLLPATQPSAAASAAPAPAATSPQPEPMPVHLTLQGQVSGFENSANVEVIVEVHAEGVDQAFNTKISADGHYQINVPPDIRSQPIWIKAHETRGDSHRTTMMTTVSWDAGKPQEIPLAFTEAFPIELPVDLYVVERDVIHGHIYDTGHQPLADAQVRVLSLNDQVPFEGQISTDANGLYALSNVPSGVSVKIFVTKAGYSDSERLEVMKSCGGGGPDRNNFDFGAPSASAERDLPGYLQDLALTRE